MKKKRFLFLVIFIIILMLPAGVFAATDVINPKIELAINTIWTLVAGFLVMFMQAGFAMVELGLTRAKNASNIIMKNLMDFAIGSIVFFVIGFGIMFGDDLFGLIGTSGFFGNLTSEALGIGVPIETFIIFQTMFAATSATIVSGAMAERTKFSAYVIYSAVISLIIYPVVGHWIWGGGWLAKLGMIDFAGSTVVHSVGGWASLIGAKILGPRIGKFDKNGKPKAIPGHSIPFAALGVFILWFGWFGFNPGSTLSGMDSGLIGKIAMTTNLAGAAGANVVMIITWIRYKKPDVSMTLNGALAGLVGVTAGCATVNMFGAIAIGTIAGVVVIFGVEFIEKVLKIDDPVGAISVHGICGSLGTILVGVFATETGLLYGHGFKQLGIQLLGVWSVFLWTIGTAYILFKVIKLFNGLRVDSEDEIKGLDISEHGTEAYTDFQVKSADIIY